MEPQKIQQLQELKHLITLAKDGGRHLQQSIPKSHTLHLDQTQTFRSNSDIRREAAEQVMAMIEFETGGVNDEETEDRYNTMLIWRIGCLIREQNGQTFCTEEKEKKLVRILANYFIRSNECILDRRKGIMLIGTPGTGKTTVMTIMREFLNCYKHGFMIRHAGDIVNDYNKKGADGICLYTYNNNGVYRSNKPIDLMIDDLGREPQGVNYGARMNVMQHIIETRYALSREYRAMRTHITTNLTREEIIRQYGNHVMDRLNEMVNIIDIEGESHRIANNIKI